MKLPSQHMVGGAAGDADHYDLPGICWISYFVTRGIAFHGTYWHNAQPWLREHAARGREMGLYVDNAHRGL
jgi:hypothetical protein